MKEDEIGKKAAKSIEEFRKQEMLDTRFSREFDSIIINDKKYLIKKDYDGKIEVITAPLRMKISEFETKWATSFLLGNINGRNYFNLVDYFKITNDGLNGITVTDNEDKEILFIVPPLTTMKVDDEQRKTMFTVGTLMNRVNPPGLERTDASKQATKDLASVLADKLDKENYIDYYELVPDWFWKERNINPRALRDTKFIMDFYKLDSNVIYNRLYGILVNVYENKMISNVDLEIIKECTLNDFILPDDVEILEFKDDVKSINNNKNNKTLYTPSSIKQIEYDENSYDEC